MIFDEIADRLEPALRQTFEASADVYDRRLALSAAIGSTTSPELRQHLVTLREEFDARAIAALIADVEAALARSADEGWATWLAHAAAALYRFRHAHALALGAMSFRLPPDRHALRAEVQRAARCMEQSRWDEVEDTFGVLGSQPSLPPRTRVRLTMLQSQVELWRYSEKKRAAALLTAAEQIAPADAVLHGAIGDLAVEQGDGEKGCEHYQQAIALAPSEGCGYVGMGEWHEKELRLDDAETWFRQAIAQAPGESIGFDRLLRLLARNDGIRTRHSEIASLFERRNAVSPAGEYDACIMLGDACRTNSKGTDLPDADRTWYLNEARAWYDRARTLERQWPMVYISLAELYKDTGELIEAERCALQAQALAPEYPSSYLFLGPFYEDQGRLDDAARTYAEFPSCPRRWKLFATATLGRVFASQGEYDRARRVLVEVLRQEAVTDREQVFAENNLESLAADHYKKRHDTAKALEVYGAILDVKGQAYSARYHRLLGDMHSHTGDHAAAEVDYRRAAEAAPQDAALLRMLADALRNQQRYDEALQAIDQAFAIDGDDRLRRDAAGTLANTQGNKAFEQGDYLAAAQHYIRASELEPAVAVYCSNLGLALERTRVKTHRAETLEHAARAYERAQRLGGNQRHADRIDRLTRRAALANTYGEQALDWVGLVTPLVVEVADDLVPVVANEARNGLSATLDREVESMRAGVRSELGVTLPGIRFRSEPALAPGTYIVQINEVPLVSDHVNVTERFFAGAAEQLSALGISGTAATDPLDYSKPGYWISEADWARLEDSSLPLWTVTGYLMRRIEAVIRQHLEVFVGHQEVVSQLGALPSEMSAALTDAPAAISALTNVCRSLSSEVVPLPPFAQLCELFKSLYEAGTRPREIVDRVRLVPGMKDTLPGRNRPSYLKTGEHFDAMIRGAMARQGDQVVLAIRPDRCQTALTAISKAASGHAPASLTILVADPLLRPFVRKLVELQFPGLPVLAVTEGRDDVLPLTERIEVEATIEPAVPDFRLAVTPASTASRRASSVSEMPASGTPTVEVTIGSGPSAVSEADGQPLDSMLSLMRDGLFQELGLLVPIVGIRRDETLQAGAFEVRIGGLPSERIEGLQPDECLVNDSPDRLRLLGLHGRDAENPATGSAAAVLAVSASTLSTCQQAGIASWGPSGYIVLHLSSRLRRHAVALQTVESTRHLLDSVVSGVPDLVDLALKRYGLPTISAVLGHLLAEEISVRNLRTILEALLCLHGTSDIDLDRFIVFPSVSEPWCVDRKGRAPADLPPWLLADFARTWLRPYISHKFTRGSSSMAVYVLDSDIEYRVRQLAGAESVDDTRRLVEAVSRVIRPTGRQIVLTNFDIRRQVYEMVRSAFPSVVVLSYQELSPQLNISRIGQISWNN